MFRILRLPAFMLLFAAAMFAQDIASDWQGTVKTTNSQLRLILQINKIDDTHWKGVAFFIDRGTQFDASTITFDGSAVKVRLDRTGDVFAGKLSADGASLVGTWTEASGAATPLELKRATKETAWPKLRFK